MAFQTIEDVEAALAGQRYLPDRPLATSVFLAMQLQQPLLVEGEAGVGKTEVARALAAATGSRLIRLQCHEGIDLHQALYDWDYQRQLLAIRAAEARDGGDMPDAQLFSRQFLLKRPLLDALEEEGPVVLLIDDIDRADDEFEAFLLEFLSDFAVTIPELGTVEARGHPVVVLTSNRTRDVHDALKRRCLYHWISHPDFERELAIIRLRAPEVGDRLARDVAAAVEALRDLELYKPPGVAETIDWAQSLATLGAERLDERSVDATLGTILKYHEDHARVRRYGLEDLVRAATGRT